MAITLRYQVPAAPLATIAEQIGVGQYQQYQDKLALEQAAQERANQDLLLRANIASLDNARANRQLDAQTAEAAMRRADSMTLGQAQIAAGLQQEMMRQQGFADSRADEAARLASEQKFRLSQEQSRIQQHYKDQQFNVAMAAGKQIEEAKATMTPEQYQQAVGGWEGLYGDAFGPYPFIGGPDAPDEMAIGGARKILSSWFGDNVTDDMARDYLDMSGKDKIALGLQASQLEINQRNAAEELKLKREAAQQEIEAKAYERQQAAEQKKVEAEQKAAATARSNLLDQQNQLQALEVAGRTQQLGIVANKIKLLQDAITKEQTAYVVDETDEAAVQASQDRIKQLQEQYDAAMQDMARISTAPSSVNLLGGQQGGGAGGRGQAEQLPTYNRQQAERAEPGERFIYNGRPVEALGNGRFNPIQ